MRLTTLNAILLGCSVASAAEDFLRRPNTIVTYLLDGAEIPQDHPSNPSMFLGDGSWSIHREGQGPQIGLEGGAQFLFSGLAVIESIHFQGSTAQSTQAETNNGTSTFLLIQHLNSSNVWETVYFNKPYEHNFDDGPQNSSFSWNLVLEDVPVLAGGSMGVRFRLDSRGYANSPPGQPYVSVDSHLLNAQVSAVPESSSFVLASLGLLGTLVGLRIRRRRQLQA